MKDSRVHLTLTVAWALLLIPTILYWKESILWVAFMSLYANIASHWSGYEASKAKEEAQE